MAQYKFLAKLSSGRLNNGSLEVVPVPSFQLYRYFSENAFHTKSKTTDSYWFSKYPDVFNENTDNCEVLVKFKVTNYSTLNINDLGGLIIGFRRSTSIYAQGYQVSIGPNEANYKRISIYRINNSSSRSELGYSVTLTNKTKDEQFSSYRYLRAKISGNTIQAKQWWHDESEPAEWGVSVTDSTWASGDLAFGLVGLEHAIDIEYIGVGTGSDAAPAYPENTTIAGTLYNPDDTVANGKKVRLYHKRSGAFLGEQVVGSGGQYSFSIPVETTELVQIIGVDQDNNEWKPPIHEAYPVL